MKKIISVMMLLVMVVSLFTIGHATPEIGSMAIEPEQTSEVLELREKNSETYRLEDGSYECVVFAEDKYFEDKTGKLVEISNTVVPEKHTIAGKEYGFTNEANSTRIYFSENEPSILVSTGKQDIAFSIATESAVTPVIGGLKDVGEIAEYSLSGDTCFAYMNAFEHTDLVYKVRNGMLKEYLVLNDAAAPRQYTFTFDTEGYTVSYTEYGTIGFCDGDGELVFELGDLFAVDSANAYTDELTYTIGETVEGKTEITVTLSEDYVSDPERVYPILVDPSVVVAGSSSTQDTYVSSKNPSSNYYTNTYIRMGWDTNYNVRRTYIKFNLPSSIPSNGITLAYMSLRKHDGGSNDPSLNAYRVTGSWTSSSITWNNKPGFTTTNASNTAEPKTNNWYRFYVTDIVKHWYDGTYQNYGFMVKNAAESGSGNWYTFYASEADSGYRPQLRITYDDQYTITYSGNGNTFGTVPNDQFVAVGNSIALAYNTGEMGKAGSCTLLGWCTNAAGTGTTYSLGQTIIPSSNMVLYAKWSNPTYAYRETSIKVWVDKTYTTKYGNYWETYANTIITRAIYPFLQTYNLNLQPSELTEIVTPKAQCSHAPNACDDTCVVGCDNHHTNALNLLKYISMNGDSNYGLNTLLYYGATTCYNGSHGTGVGGLAYYPNACPYLQASMIQCISYVDQNESYVWGSVRRVQHEWSHNFNARHTGDGGTECTSPCINNSGWDNTFFAVPDVWCDRCKAAMSGHLGDY